MVLQVNNGTRTRIRPSKKLSLDHLRDKLLIEAKHHEDVLVKGRDIMFGDDGLITVRGGGTRSGDKFSWNDYAFGQFCAKIEVPADFVRRSPLSGPASKKSIVDHWKEQVDGKTFLMRLHNLDTPDEKTGADGYVRAFLTERFSKFDNLELLNVAEPFIESRGLEIQIGHHSDKSFHMRLLDPNVIDVGIDKPDPHQTGIHVLNSEVGAFNLQGDFLVYRQICTNGLIALFDKKHLFSHKHVGIEAHEIRARFSAGLEMMQDRTQSVVDRLQTLQEATIPDPLRELHAKLKANRATDEFINLAFVAYQEEPMTTQYGVIQAITRAAQRLSSFDQRTEMEELAGRLLLAA